MVVHYEIVKYRPEFRQQVVELLWHLKGRDHARNSAYLEWKYERDPYQPEPLIYLALHEGRVVGMRGVYGGRWGPGAPDRSCAMVCAADLVVAPEHRRRGLYGKIMDYAVRDLRNMGYEYLVNTGAVPANFFASLKMGWRSPGPFRTVRRQSGRAAVARRLRAGANRLPVIRRYSGNRLFPFLPSLRNPFRPLDEMAARGGPVDGPISLASTPRPAEMAELVARIGTDGRVRHARDREFLAWRYQNPYYLFRFIFWEGDRLEGYLALQARPETGRAEASMVEWEASSPEIGAALLRAALVMDMLSVWSATLDQQTTTILRDTGFRSFDESLGVPGYRPSLLVRALDEAKPESEWRVDGRNLLDLADWDLRMLHWG